MSKQAPKETAKTLMDLIGDVPLVHDWQRPTSMRKGCTKLEAVYAALHKIANIGRPTTLVMTYKLLDDLFGASAVELGKRVEGHKCTLMGHSAIFRPTYVGAWFAALMATESGRTCVLFNDDGSSDLVEWC